MLEQGGKGKGVEIVDAWLNREDPSLKFHAWHVLPTCAPQVVTDYPIVSVAVRRLAQLLQAGAH